MLKVLAARSLCRELRAKGGLDSIEPFAQSLRDLYGAACVAIARDADHHPLELAVPSSLLTPRWAEHLPALLEIANHSEPFVLRRGDSRRLFKRRATMTTVVIPLEAPSEGQRPDVLLIAWPGERQLEREEMIALALLGQDVALSLDRANHSPCRITERQSTVRHTPGEDASLEHEKGEFLSLVAHELRTPLTPMTILLQSLEHKARAGVVDLETVVRARRQASRLTALTSHLLDFSRIDTLTMEREVEPFDLSVIIKDVVDSFRSRLAKHTIETVVAGGALLVSGDKVRLEQVISSLLDNAIKYSPAGGSVLVEASRSANEISVSVTDQGIGIPEEEREHIFGRFFRGDNVSSREYRGFGIGLHLAKAIVEKHGGQLFLASSPGRGSRFVVQLPLAALDDSETRQKGPARLLLADDDPDILQIAGDMLEEAGYEVLRARDGAEALHYVETASPDVVLLDLMMPILSGWDVLGRLRNSERWCPIPIVVLSAHHKAAEQAGELRANAYLTKPFGVEALIRMVEGMLQSGSPPGGFPSA